MEARYQEDRSYSGPQLEALLARSEARFRDVIERNADAIVVVGRDGTVRFANPAAESLFGKPRQALIGSPFGFPLVTDETTELDLPRNGQPARIVEMRVVESEWEGRTAYLASLRDVTERREAEESARHLIREQAARSAAEAAAARLRFLADSGTVLSSSLDYRETLAALVRLSVSELADWAVAYVVDREGAVGRLETAHRELQREEALRRLRDQPIDPDSGHPVLEVLRTRQPLLERAADPGRMETLARAPELVAAIRELGVASYILVPMVARGRAVGALELVRSDPERRFGEDDLTLATDLARRAALGVDNARLYREAQEANRAKSEVLAVISHDLRTPLSSIIGYAELLSMGVPDPLSDGSLHHVERIRTATHHLLYLIEELLAFAKLDAGREELQLRDIRAELVVREVAEVIEPLAAERGLDLHVEVAEDVGSLRTDPGKLRQTLVNLAGNAVKFTDPGGRVRLEAEPVDGSVRFTVQDTGRGIAPEHLEQIFQPFWQVPSDGDSPGGTGLGLSVVRRLASLLGGQVSVQSTPGTGSEFVVTIPRRALPVSD